MRTTGRLLKGLIRYRDRGLHTQSITGYDQLRPTYPDVRGLLKFPLQNVLPLASRPIVVTIKV